MDFIDFRALHNELQGSQSVEEKGGRDVCEKQYEIKEASNKQPDKAASIVNPLIISVHLLWTDAEKRENVWIYLSYLISDSSDTLQSC